MQDEEIWEENKAFPLNDKEIENLLSSATWKEKLKLAENALQRLRRGYHVNVNVNILKLVASAIERDAR